jgi:hypothetical protein
MQETMNSTWNKNDTVVAYRIDGKLTCIDCACEQLVRIWQPSDPDCDYYGIRWDAANVERLNADSLEALVVATDDSRSGGKGNLYPACEHCGEDITGN